MIFGLVFVVVLLLFLVKCSWKQEKLIESFGATNTDNQSQSEPAKRPSKQGGAAAIVPDNADSKSERKSNSDQFLFYHDSVACRAAVQKNKIDLALLGHYIYRLKGEKTEDEDDLRSLAQTALLSRSADTRREQLGLQCQIAAVSSKGNNSSRVVRFLSHEIVLLSFLCVYFQRKGEHEQSDPTVDLKLLVDGSANGQVVSMDRLLDTHSFYLSSPAMNGMAKLVKVGSVDWIHFHKMMKALLAEFGNRCPLIEFVHGAHKHVHYALSRRCSAMRSAVDAVLLNPPPSSLFSSKMDVFRQWAPSKRTSLLTGFDKDDLLTTIKDSTLTDDKVLERLLDLYNVRTIQPSNGCVRSFQTCML